MDLLASRTSPYARKIRILIKLLKIEKQISIDYVDPFSDPDALTQINPLSKVPALLLDNGTSIVGSALITDYLCAHFHGESILPTAGTQRWEILRQAAMAEGIIDAAVAMVLESRRPEDKRQEEKSARQAAIIRRTLNVLGESTSPLSIDNPTNYEVTLGTALAYLGFRHTGTFTQDIPANLASWLQDFEGLPCMQETQPPQS